jgi:dihydrolipoamide dehydrogenase
MTKDIETDVAIIGAGTAGLYALREVRRARRDFVLIDHGPLGTTCARVGCMPSKIALHAGGLWAAREEMERFGVAGTGGLTLDRARAWAVLRAQRDHFANSTAGKARSAAGDRLVDGRARFIEPTVLEVEGDAGRTIVRARSVVIATGSRPVRPAWLDALGRRAVTTDTFFELPDLPPRIGILGLGAIGLEMGLALARLGISVTGADLASTVAGLADPDLSARAIERFGKDMTLWLGASASVDADGDALVLRSGEREARVDLLLAALGRRPNVDGLGLAEAGFELDARAAPLYDPATMQLGSHAVFIAGDANAQRPLMHEAADEGAIAGYNAARGLSTRFRRRVPLAIAFTDPDVCAIGARIDELDPARTLVGTATGEANGRSRILGGEASLLHLYADRRDGRLLGAAMMATGGEHLAHLLAWAIQRGETVPSLLEMPFYHPVIEEMLQSALQDAARQLGRGDPLPVGLRAEGAT